MNAAQVFIEFATLANIIIKYTTFLNNQEQETSHSILINQNYADLELMISQCTYLN